MNMLFEVPQFKTNEIEIGSFTDKTIKLIVARLDKIHPIVSGNKLFKLYYFLEAALEANHTTIITFGGAYSNHLLATAYCCKLAGLRSIGIVRGERPANLFHTLVDCESYGMDLRFISREAYKNKADLSEIDDLSDEIENCTIIPEGGYHPLGAKGAALIMDQLHDLNATHICTATGTATTLAGLLQNSPNHETIIGVPILKGMEDIEQRISYLNNSDNIQNLVLFDEYHFGGYAKSTKALIGFMNSLFKEYHLPTDFVYTAKMMYAVIDKIKQGFFEDGSCIVALHTGGLQGNASLPPGSLVF